LDATSAYASAMGKVLDLKINLDKATNELAPHDEPLVFESITIFS
jgi:hypothetical protein